jgi:hypothetical protein
MIVSHKRTDATLQDQATQIRALRFFNALGNLTLTGAVTIGSRQLTVASAVGVSVGHILYLEQNGRQFQPIVTSIAGAPTLVIDSPFDYAYTVAASVTYGIQAMNVNGSVTPVTFAVGAAPGTRVDITQIRISIIDNVEMDDGKFGGITALTNGVVLQKCTPSATYHIGNVKSNGELRLFCTGEYASKSPAGQYGFSAVCHFGGQENAGVVLRLNGTSGDRIDLTVQDNLTSLTMVNAIAIGHIVED